MENTKEKVYCDPIESLEAILKKDELHHKNILEGDLEYRKAYLNKFLKDLLYLTTIISNNYHSVKSKSERSTRKIFVFLKALDQLQERKYLESICKYELEEDRVSNIKSVSKDIEIVNELIFDEANSIDEAYVKQRKAFSTGVGIEDDVREIVLKNRTS